MFSWSIAWTQKSELKKANNYFKKAYYYKAIPLLESLISQNIDNYDIIRKTGDSYYYNNRMMKASIWYGNMISRFPDSVSSDYYFKYYHSLKAINKIDRSEIFFEKYLKKSKQNDFLSRFKDKQKELRNIRAIGNRFEIESLNINTSESEFGAIMIDSILVFSAPKSNKKGLFRKQYKWNNQRYLDLFVVSIDSLQNILPSILPLSKKINSSNHEAITTYSKDRKIMYFTRTSSKKDANKIYHLKIYKAVFEGDKWRDVKELPFNNKKYSIMHPALSPDGKTLYFSSDMPGGIGGYDLYSVEVLGDNKYSKPKNLGSKVNTSQKEQFPFISGDNNIYFSSNGHLGFGSMDVYMSEILENDYSDPKNIGLPINSAFDDFAFNIESSTKKGFFSSNRPSGRGGDDIYSFKEIKELIIEDCKQYIEGVIIDKTTSLPLENVDLNIVFDEKGDFHILSTDIEGRFKLEVLCEKTYTITASKNMYESSEIFVKTDLSRGYIHDASMYIYSVYDRQIAEYDKEVASNKKEKEREKIRIAKAEEKVKQDLSLKIKRKEMRIKSVIKEEKYINNIEGQISIDGKNIYFVYGMSYVRFDTKEKLKSVVSLMKKYPKMIIEIKTHTDTRGRKKYNLDLSQSRAEQMRLHLADTGIEVNRVIATGCGENEPVEKCIKGKECTEEQHELNRRCEFLIISIE